MSREDRIEAHRRKIEAGAAERVAKHDRQFAAEYVPGAAGSYPVSVALARQLGVQPHCAGQSSNRDEDAA